ncbi:hypothetical protein [Sphingobium aromaticiconvertens]|uniref:hypothetical protein n=1 Tax=Sphingobium aromaticiconvertens TaxID=365341 RepID=UPI0030186142
MTEHKFNRYDSADYLDSEATIAAYLDAAKGEGGDDPAYMAHVHGVVARARASTGATSTASETEPKPSNG